MDKTAQLGEYYPSLADGKTEAQARWYDLGSLEEIELGFWVSLTLELVFFFCPYLFPSFSAIGFQWDQEVNTSVLQQLPSVKGGSASFQEVECLGCWSGGFLGPWGPHAALNFKWLMRKQKPVPGKLINASEFTYLNWFMKIVTSSQ